MIVSLIAAMTPQRVIGKQGSMPWHLPSDLRWFKENTLNKPVIMGHTTWKSLGKALPNRINVVLSSQPSLVLEGAMVINSLQQAFELLSAHDEVMVIGGGQIYTQALPFAQRFYLTLIHADISGDTYFPSYAHSEWQPQLRIDCQRSEHLVIPCSFLILERL